MDTLRSPWRKTSLTSPLSGANHEVRVPLPNGKPALSSGVERELHHAFEGGKEVFVVWTCKAMPSPFITETATKVFKSTDEAIAYFKQKGYVK